ncbi:sigma-54 factor interaction domain-containing protein [Paraliomyxa miuraensis]|uniref:sigma-54 factor interaction domain-containing protein n=1 Tax=Paraliomyxa miuraensis TaxID=376150 RepID=UPI00224FD186|nr:sigma-54 factor interaction domain-containing protein [Paraliomyxa miuraensis]MCX4243905.1 sigma-54 factor interaction domain-containing protein [Paraliomyxa miuraensis]
MVTTTSDGSLRESSAHGFDARTPARRHALGLARRVASHRCPVLIMGPTGVGKEVLAEDIHRHGDRATKRFVAVNCAAVSSALFESTFFGHMRGSFTGATSDKPGLVELADRGTLFLDEVGELSLDNQAKLLRFLAQGTYWPVGSTTERRADVRIISATNRDISVGSDAFREDLYYRLSVITIRIPRLEPVDVKAIARSLAIQLAAHHGIDLEDDDVATVAEHCAGREWNGGARELRNLVERLMVLWTPDRPREELFAEVLGERSRRAGPARQERAEPSLASARVSKDLDSLVFLGIAAQCEDVKELAQRTERTVQAVYLRLKKLGLGPRNIGQNPELTTRMEEFRRRVAPELPWIRVLLTGS